MVSSVLPIASLVGIADRWRGRILSGLRAAADLLYPPACPWCRREVRDPATSASSGSLAGESSPDSAAAAATRSAAGLCEECCRTLAAEGGEWCPRCAARVGPYGSLPEGCRHCRDEGYGFRSAVTLGMYDGELRPAILASKQAAGEGLALSLAELLLTRRRAWFEGTPVDAVIPVPHHWARRLTSGHLASETVAHRLAGALGLPCWQDAVAKTRWTPQQQGLSATDRRSNLKSAFVRTGRPLGGQRLLLVDDVMTTGRTAQVVTRALLDAGAAEVHVAVLARSVVS